MPSKSAAAAGVVEQVAADLLARTHRGVIVDSPPGAGKSTLVVEIARRLAATGEPVMVVAQTNEQVDDLVDRMAAKHGPTAGGTMTIGRLSASTYVPTDRVQKYLGHGVTTGGKYAELGTPQVTIATAAKWTRFGEDTTWPWAILDEAYQMRSDGLLAIAPRFAAGCALFVGDPGQLDPFATVGADRWAGSAWDPTDSAVAVVRAHNPDLPVHRLPYSWRLPASAADLVARAFYPFTLFEAGTELDDRSLDLGPARGTRGAGGAPYLNRLDEALNTAAETGWARYELPARYTVRTDAEALNACADLAARLLVRGAVAVDQISYPEGHQVTADRIAVGAAHRDQVSAIRAALDRHGPATRDITVDTANRLQGREYDVTVVLHPLSGRRDATAFHLETGRLCVLLSRHRHACIVVARAGISDLLDAHPHTDPVYLNVPVRFPDGWEAHQTILEHLAKTSA
ncbi:MAG TPA: AAA domain-containing protein [Actinocrinis sp.]|nr:AAA domain-containing protein [Actinocrinis sp.]